MKKVRFFFLVVPLVALRLPAAARAAGGLGSAGSITLDGLLIGMAVVGIIVLVFMGLLLLARVRELSQLIRKSRSKNVRLKPEDVMNMTATEIGLLQTDRGEAH